MSLKPWKLISAKMYRQGKWFPIEERTYELPDGRIIDDFTVTTLANVSMIVPITSHGKIVMVRQFKPGIGEIVIQFPAGRMEPHYSSMEQLALQELREETGIQEAETSQLHFVAKLHAFSTKASEVVFVYVAEQCEINSVQLDTTEEIETLYFAPEEVDELIMNGGIWDADAIASWHVLRGNNLNY